MRFALTLNDVGHHEGGAGIVADETTAGQVAFNLEGEQIPGAVKAGEGGGRGSQRWRTKREKLVTADDAAAKSVST